MPSFLGGKSRSAFGQPLFVLVGNRMTIVAFEKEVSLKSLAKRYFDSTEVLKLLALKKLSENALRFETDVVLNILPSSADFTCVDGPTMLEV